MKYLSDGAVTSHNTKNGTTKQVIIFRDSIIPGKRIMDFNKHINNGFANFKVFSGCDSKEMLHYVEPALETGYHDTETVHAGVNELLNDKSANITYNLTSNLVSIVKKCNLFSLKNYLFMG